MGPGSDPYLGSLTSEHVLGIPVTSRHPEAWQALKQGLNDLSLFTGNPVKDADNALSLDPHFLLAHCFKSAIFLLMGQQAGEGPTVQPHISAIKEEVEKRNDSEKDPELQHARAILSLLDGDYQQAREHWWQCIRWGYGRDAMALRFSTDCCFYLGDHEGQRDCSGWVLSDPTWQEEVDIYNKVLSSDPGYRQVDLQTSNPCFAGLMSIHSFALNECKMRAQAEDVGRRALALAPHNAWAVHSLSHIYEETSQFQKGIALISKTEPQWIDSSLVVSHVTWHHALFWYHLDQIDRTLAVFDKQIRRTRSEVVTDLIDATSLLWRLEMAGVDVGDRWAEVTACWSRRRDTHFSRSHSWCDLHFVMTMMCAKNIEIAAQRELGLALIQHVTARVAAPENRGHPFWQKMERVGVPVLRAVEAYALGQYTECLQSLAGAKGPLDVIGGSNAQRDILNLLAIYASARSGNGRGTLARIISRVDERPQDPATLSLFSLVEGSLVPKEYQWRLDAERLIAAQRAQAHLMLTTCAAVQPQSQWATTHYTDEWQVSVGATIGDEWKDLRQRINLAKPISLCMTVQDGRKLTTPWLKQAAQLFDHISLACRRGTGCPVHVGDGSQAYVGMCQVWEQELFDRLTELSIHVEKVYIGS